ncbi:F-box only protein 43 [Alligator sinensis]|uniref:F-box only protein 43 n=2 Tax=Alligator TaxID=8495 RepID=A0A3Q0H387_ALLSI|nr:F-box only protein 43 [Alligator sinensis]XP_025066519.1 F-box only protein 43 [Alligator sinensis]
MSESHSLLTTLKRSWMTSPSNNIKYSCFKDSYSTSIFQDSGYNESLKDPCLDHPDAEHKEAFSLLHECSEYSHPSLVIPVLSSTEIEKNSTFLSERRKANLSVDFFETPKASKKDPSLRRRLLLSKTASDNTLGCFERRANSSWNSRKKTLSHSLSFEDGLAKSVSDSPRDKNYKPLATSTLKTEESSPSCQKWRLAFSQQRTSTVDDSKCKNSLLPEPECLSPIQCNASKETTVGKTPNELIDSALTSSSNESTSMQLLKTPTCMLSWVNENKFLTPVSNLLANFKLNLSDTPTPPVKVVSDLDLSTPEDSGYNSLSLDKTEDSLSHQEGSFQELFQNHKETPKILDINRKLRKLDQFRRLSTLQERGSHSETEEDNDITLNNSEYELKIRETVNKESGLVFDEENSGNLFVKLGDLSRTPALQVVQEICIQRQKRSSQQNECLENAYGAEMSVLDYILAGLIGKKMGLEKLDILTELKYRDLKHVLAIVLEALTVENLCSIWKVSKNWREIVVQDKNAYQRRKLYIKQQKAEAGGCLLNVEDAATRFNILSRSALRPVQAQAKTALFQTPPCCIEPVIATRCSSVSSSTSKQEEYFKVARSLFTDEALKPCPRCQHPAKYQPLKKRGLCSRETCAFDFCIVCLCAFHGSKECCKTSAKWQNKKDALPGSAQSKRNLKRL